MSNIFIGYTFIALVFFSNISSAQTLNEISKDTLNKYAQNGKKTGYWIELLNAQFMPVNKKEQAAFYRLIYFYNGKRYKVPIIPHWFGTIKINGNKPVQGQIIALDGEYSFYFKNFYLGVEHYSKGKITGIEKYCGLYGGIDVYENHNINYGSLQPSCYVLAGQNGRGDYQLKAYYRYDGKDWSYYRDTVSRMNNKIDSEKNCTLHFYRNDKKQLIHSLVYVVINDSLRIFLKAHDLVTINLLPSTYKFTCCIINYKKNKWDYTENLAPGKEYYYKIIKDKDGTIRLEFTEKGIAEKEISNEKIKE